MSRFETILQLTKIAMGLVALYVLIRHIKIIGIC